MLVGGFGILSTNFQVCVGSVAQASLLSVAAEFAVEFGTCAATRLVTSISQ